MITIMTIIFLAAMNILRITRVCVAIAPCAVTVIFLTMNFLPTWVMIPSFLMKQHHEDCLGYHHLSTSALIISPSILVWIMHSGTSTLMRTLIILIIIVISIMAETISSKPNRNSRQSLHQIILPLMSLNIGGPPACNTSATTKPNKGKTS